jgi:hypothetical protein
MTDAPTVKLEIVGLKEALRELNNLDKTARREITRDFKRICKPVVDAAKRAVPKEAPISGWNRAWKPSTNYQALPWKATLATSRIQAKVSGKKPREYNGRMTNLAVFSIAWAGAINTIFDLAGRGGRGDTAAGANMIRGLEARRGKASRVLWPAYEANKNEVERELAAIIDDVMRQVSKAI